MNHHLKQIKHIIYTILIVSVLSTNIVLAAFTEPTTAPSSSDQDFPQNILGANNNNNDFDSTNVTANNDGSLIERLEYIITSLSSLWTKVGNLLYYNTGNVGIGTSTPSALLEVSGDGQSALKVTDVTNSITTGIWSGTTQGSIGTLTNTDLRFLTNGTSKMTIDTSGNVGVGTTIPNIGLLSARVLTLGTGTSGGNGVIELFGFTGSTDGLIGSIDAQNGNDGDSNASARISFLRSDNGNNSSVMTFSTRSALGSPISEAMRIDRNGNVGIGTTTPTATLEIEANTYYPLKVISSEGANLFLFGDDANRGHLDIYHQGTLGARLSSVHNSFLNSVGGNVGIGTTVPTSKLEVRASINPYIRITKESDTTGQGLAFNVNSTQNWVIGTYLTGTAGLEFYDGSGTSGTKMSIQDNTGNVGIGTTGPGYQLHVSGSGSTGGSFGLTNTTAAKTWNLQTFSDGNLYFTRDAGVTVLELLDNGNSYFNGNIGIGITNPSTKLQVYNGNITVSDSDVSHPFTSRSEFGLSSSAYGSLSPVSSTSGGLHVMGANDADSSYAAVYITGLLGSASPSVPAVRIMSGKTDGSGSYTSLAATENVFNIRNLNSDLVTVLGNGNLGIGTVSPSSKLDVVGDVEISGKVVSHQILVFAGKAFCAARAVDAGKTYSSIIEPGSSATPCTTLCTDAGFVGCVGFIDFNHGDWYETGTGGISYHASNQCANTYASRDFCCCYNN